MILETVVEVKIGVADAGPDENGPNTAQITEPEEDFRTTVACIKERGVFAPYAMAHRNEGKNLRERNHPKDWTGGVWNTASRVLCLLRDHDHPFTATIRQGCLNKEC